LFARPFDRSAHRFAAGAGHGNGHGAVPLELELGEMGQTRIIGDLPGRSKRENEVGCRMGAISPFSLAICPWFAIAMRPATRLAILGPDAIVRRPSLPVGRLAGAGRRGLGRPKAGSRRIRPTDRSMNDAETALVALKELVRRFGEERDWQRF